MVDLLLRRRQMMVAGASPLPYDHEVAWLQSDGNVYIDTGIKAAGSVEMKISLVDYFVAANKGNWAFGGRNAYQNNMYGLFIDGTTSKASFAYQNSFIYLDLYGTYNASEEVTIAGGSLNIGTHSYTYTTKSFTSTRNIILFGLMNGGSPLVMGVKIGAAYIKQGATIVDLIPVRKNGVGYMYDRTSGQLMPISGAGAFLIGPDV